jgi:O-antigen ligase
VLSAFVLGVRWNSSGALDALLTLVAGAVLLQIVPLPLPGSGHWISPHRAEVVAALRLGAPAADGFPTWSIDVPSTVWAFAVLGGTIVLFWIARTEFRRGGVRQTARAVSALGLGVSLLAVAQAATAGGLIYWTFPTEFEGPPPFGPFVNRNHFATWAIMAVPLCFGYLAARLGTDRAAPKHSSFRGRLVRATDPRTAWLTVAGGTMLVALLLSLSRSGVLALGVSAAITFAATRHRLERRQRRLVVQATLAILILGVLWADVPALMRRAAGAPTALADRVTIWRESLPIVRDFWQVGTGAGTYQVAMSVYQRSDRTVYFNQAHNHYLQIAVEGGALMLALAVACAVAFVREARRRIAADTSGLVLIRVGAMCGLGAVAVQSVWETGLVMPANAALAALLAAIVVHERGQ